MGESLMRQRLEGLVRSGIFYVAHECGTQPWENEYGYPVQPPEEIDCLNLYGKGGDQRNIIATSTRVVTIAREIAGGELGDRYGITVARDGRGRTQYIMGGGQVSPDIREEPLEEDLAAESVRECAVRELDEELRIEPSEADLLLFGVRTITGEGTHHPRMRRDRVCADICFLYYTEERLMYAEGLNKEAGERSVLDVAELVSAERDKKTGLLPLPASQALVLATAIIYAHEVLGDAMPEPIKRVVLHPGSLDAARKAILKNPWRNQMIPVIQIGQWKGIELL